MMNLRDLLLKHKLPKKIELNPKIIELKKYESLDKKKDIYYQNVGIRNR